MAEPDARRATAFMELLHAFQRVDRVVHVPRQSRWENDVEHSYLLAMLAWYLVDSLKLPLNKGMVLQYALIHDLVEVYAGDTYAFTDDEELKKSKPRREHDAQQRIEKEFPEFPDLHATIKHYEQRGDEESVFVHRLDKLIPIITIYIQDGRTWKDRKVAFDQLKQNKRERIGDQPQVRALLEQIIAAIDADRERYFDN